MTEFRLGEELTIDGVPYRITSKSSNTDIKLTLYTLLEIDSLRVGKYYHQELLKALNPESDMVNHPAHRNEVSDFEDNVRTTLEKVGDLLIEKNKAYGNSALDPVRIFSKSDATEQLRVRIDDKLSRFARGSEYPGDDTVTDLLGYLVLLKIASDNA